MLTSEYGWYTPVLHVISNFLQKQTLKYQPASWRVPYDHVVLKDSRQSLVPNCLQLLLVLVNYRLPEDGKTSKRNHFRYDLGRLHRLQDFQFLVDGMARILNQPVRLKRPFLPCMISLMSHVSLA